MFLLPMNFAQEDNHRKQNAAANSESQVEFEA